MTNKQKLSQFIIDNDLTFVEGERNANSTVISGYALHIGAELSEIKEAIEESCASKAEGCYEELERVFKYAKANSYGKYWATEDAKAEYTF